MRRWWQTRATRSRTLADVVAENLTHEPAAIGTLHAMIKGAMAAQDSSTTRAEAAWLN